MQTETLNLARKWRSRGFDHIVGQDLSIRMIKNSLYKGYIFPVYLFSGQRGCGKTTTARVFAAAINCQRLPAFRQDPHGIVLPCHTCQSCLAAIHHQHPDFIEIDAASHTGVEHVRELIDAASLLPVMGTKRIYLIDEAHMLSKAAFNALLKILEEPPRSALFILATTDPQKIIETVRSRCFQLFFDAIHPRTLRDYLMHICQQEQITYDSHAIDLIVQESHGCVRDALNIIDQVRCANGDAITAQAVHEVLGCVSQEKIIMFLDAIVSGNPQRIVAFFEQESLVGRSIEYVWRRLMDLMRIMLWMKYGVNDQVTEAEYASLVSIAKSCTIERLYALFNRMSQFQAILFKASAQPTIFEAFLLTLCKKTYEYDGRGGASAVPMPPVQEDDDTDEDDECDDNDQEDDEIDEDEAVPAQSTDQWRLFLQRINTLDDPLVTSLFTQVVRVACDAQTQQIQLIFPSHLMFFNDLLEQTKHVWYPHFQACYGANSTYAYSFTHASNNTALKSTSVTSRMPEPAQNIVVQTNQQMESPLAATRTSSQQKSYTPTKTPYRTTMTSRAPLRDQIIDVSDVQVWPTVNRVLHYFPGTVMRANERTV